MSKKVHDERGPAEFFIILDEIREQYGVKKGRILEGLGAKPPRYSEWHNRAEAILGGSWPNAAKANKALSWQLVSAYKRELQDVIGRANMSKELEAKLKRIKNPALRSILRLTDILESDFDKKAVEKIEDDIKKLQSKQDTQ